MLMKIFNMIILFIILFLITISLLLMNFLFFKKMFTNREKNSSFECGFDMMSNPRIPFSNHFFLISMMFLIFDIEITLLLPIIIQMKMIKHNNSLITTILYFMLILILSIYIEYSENMIEWKIH